MKKSYFFSFFPHICDEYHFFNKKAEQAKPIPLFA